MNFYVLSFAIVFYSVGIGSSIIDLFSSPIKMLDHFTPPLASSKDLFAKLTAQNPMHQETCFDPVPKSAAIFPLGAMFLFCGQ